MVGYLSADIICSSKLTVFLELRQPRSQGPLLPVPWSERGNGKERTLGTRLELRSRKTVHFSEQIMSADKYPTIFSRQMKAIVYIYLSQDFYMAKGKFDILYLCAGGGGGAIIFSFDKSTSLVGGVRKKNPR